MSLQEKDTKYIWHPFTQMKNANNILPVVKAEGLYLITEDGRKIMDGVSSWWTNLHGHSHPYLAKAVAEQFNTLEHVIFAGFTHPKAIELAERILGKLPYLDKVFFSDNGSTAVEVALKMAFQYWHNNNQPKTKIIAFKDAYHGDTFGAMSVGGRNGFNQPFDSFLFDVEFIDVPTKGNEEKTLLQLKNLVEKKDVAAFIFEPLVQGSAGMVMYNPQILEKLVKLCKINNVLTIADEVMTGFRLSRGGAQEIFDITPDITCLGKIIGGGLPVGAYGGRRDIMEMVAPLGPVYQAGTLSGNPLAMKAGIETLKILQKPHTYERLNALSERLEKGMKDAARSAGISTYHTRVGSMLCTFFSELPVTDYETAKRSDTETFGRFFLSMLEQGIYLAPSQFEALFVSTAHQEEHIDKTIDAAHRSFRKL